MKSLRSTFSITKKTSGRIPNLPFLRIKERILGIHYVASIVFSPPALSKKLNNRYRKRPKPANVLSFPLSKQEGEIFIDTKQVKRDAHKFKKSYKAFLLFVFIHAVLHLKGFRHGSTMEKEEKKYLRQFSSSL